MAANRFKVYKCHSGVLHAHDVESLLVHVASNINSCGSLMRLEIGAAAQDYCKRNPSLKRQYCTFVLIVNDAKTIFDACLQENSFYMHAN